MKQNFELNPRKQKASAHSGRWSFRFAFSSLLTPHSSFRPVVLLTFSLAFATSISLAQAQSSSDRGRTGAIEITPALRDYCKLVYACGLKIGPGRCPAPTELGPPAPYSRDGERCLEARELESRGLRADHPDLGFRLYRFLGHEFRVTYQIPDTVTIARARLEFLLDDIPRAAKLVAHYRKTPYRAEYVDAARTHFKGEKGTRLRGEARRISGSYSEARLIYIGTGTAEVAMWTLVGPAMMDFRYQEIPPAPGSTRERVAYDLKVVVFPGNSIINSIMNLGLFRSIVTSKIRDVVVDITETARLLAEDEGRSLLQSGNLTALEKRKVETLLTLR